MNSREILERLVAFPTVSRDSNLELIGYVREFLAARGIGSRLYRDASGRKANLHASVGCPAIPTSFPSTVRSGPPTPSRCVRAAAGFTRAAPPI